MINTNDLKAKLEEINKMKEQITSKIKELEQNKQQLSADLHAHQGAEQMLLILIKECEENKDLQEETPEAE